MHVQQHQVRVLDQQLHFCCESCAGGPVNDAMVSRDADRNHVGWLPSVAFFLLDIFHILGLLAGFANSYDSCLRSQDHRGGVGPSDVADARHTESAIGKVISSKLVLVCLASQLDYVLIDLQDALRLDLLDVWHR